MSDKYTVVQTPHGSMGLWGHVDPVEALIEARAHYRRELESAAAALASLDADDVTVHHQKGIHVARNRKLVYPK